MAKYFKIKDNETLDLFIVISDEQPENSVLLTDENSNFIKPKANSIVFTEVVEDAAKEEIAQINNQKIEELNQLQFQELSRTDWAYIRERELGVEIPIKIVEERKAIREKFHNLKQQLK
jgi:5-bromo-4-chloroindolyl phosphate hydrolysis protein